MITSCSLNEWLLIITLCGTTHCTMDPGLIPTTLPKVDSEFRSPDGVGEMHNTMWWAPWMAAIQLNSTRIITWGHPRVSCGALDVLKITITIGLSCHVFCVLARSSYSSDLWSPADARRVCYLWQNPEKCKTGAWQSRRKSRHILFAESCSHQCFQWLKVNFQTFKWWECKSYLLVQYMY